MIFPLDVAKAIINRLDNPSEDVQGIIVILSTLGWFAIIIIALAVLAAWLGGIKRG